METKLKYNASRGRNNYNKAALSVCGLSVYMCVFLWQTSVYFGQHLTKSLLIYEGEQNYQTCTYMVI